LLCAERLVVRLRNDVAFIERLSNRITHNGIV
jgi:hypothetical protein